MKIMEVKSLGIVAIKVVKFARFCDHRGFFSEHFRKSDVSEHLDMQFLKGVEFVQANESFSKEGTIRGLHFQWNPFMGKLVRTLRGHMVDMVLDIREGSPTFGKIVCYDMPADDGQDYGEWIWVPPGFAHGNFFLEDTRIEYLCSGEYSQGCEAGISPMARDIDWSLCDSSLKAKFDSISEATKLITDKDRNGLTIEGWLADKRSGKFVYGEV